MKEPEEQYIIIFVIRINIFLVIMLDKEGKFMAEQIDTTNQMPTGKKSISCGGIPSPGTILQKMEDTVSQTEFRSFIIAFLLGAIILFPMLSEKLCWNDLNRMGIIHISEGYYSWMDYCGRYLDRIYAKIRSWYVYNWVSVLFYLLWSFLGAFISVRLLRIKSWLGILLAALFLILSPALFESLPYCLDDYILAFFLCSASVMILDKKQSLFHMLLGAGMLWIACALYQAYYFTAALLCLFVLIRDLMEEKISLKEWGIKIVWFIGENLLGLFLYFQLMNAFVFLGIAENTAGRFSDNMNLGINELFSGIKNAYLVSREIYFGNAYFYNSWRGLGLVNLLLLILSVFFLCFRIYKFFTSNKPFSGVLTILLILLIPAVIGGMSILDYAEIRLMLLPTMTLPYLGLLGLMENSEIKAFSGFKEGQLRNLIEWSTYLLLAFLVFHFGLYINIFQLTLRYHNEKALSLSQEILEQIDEKYPDVIQSGPAYILIYGDPEDVFPDPYNIQQTNYIIKSFACRRLFGSDIPDYVDAWPNYLNYNFGRNFGYINRTDGQAIYNSDLFRNMDIFPGDNSIALSENGVIVVKLAP